ncbi:MAG: AAA family ATPase, partial [Deltaproteobacteria bacterium]|nr:AAA family ATPase [Deltaproteobacteria bacterium]
YGPNEAGKSSALRGLKQALFGIPVRTADNFLHPHQQMRVGAILQHSDGSLVEIIRRKGRNNTLRAGNDKDVLDDSVLEKFLGGISAEVFETMFGIGHEDLVRGGQEILEGSGNVGQALFAAGSGIADLRLVQADLQKEAEALFSPSASKRRINEALSELRKNQALLKEAELPGAEWEKHDRALREAISRRKELDYELQEKLREKNRLERIKEALPLIAQRKEILEKFKEYADAILLPEDFGERRINLLSALEGAQSLRDEALQALGEIEKEIAKLEVPQPILDNSEAIEELYQRLGSHRKAAKDRVQLVTRSSVLRSEAKAILSRLRDDLTLEEADRLKLKTTEIARIESLGSKHDRLVSKRESVEEEISRLTASLARIEGEINSVATPKSTEALIEAVERAKEYATLEKQCKSELLEIQNSEKGLRSKLAQRSLWSGSLQEVESLAIPPSETIDRFEKVMGEAEVEINRLRSAVSDTEEELIKIRGSIESLRLEQEVPTEEDLVNARKLRHEGWGLVKKAWQEGKQDSEAIAHFVESFQSGSSLAEAYEISVKQADEIGDRLRREADRVATKAKLLGDEQAKRALLDRLKGELNEAHEKLKRLRLEWAEQWKRSGVTPLSPREMRAWSQDVIGIAEGLSKLRERKTKVEAQWIDTERQRQVLSECLQSLGEASLSDKESLSDLIKRANRIIKTQEKLKANKEKLITEKKAQQNNLEDARSKAKRLETDLKSWKREWKKCLSPLGLSADTEPVQAKAFLEDLKELFDKLKEAEILQKRIKGMDRDADQFEEDLRRLAQRIAPDLVERSLELLATELNVRLKYARSAEATIGELEKQKKKQSKRLKDAQSKLRDLEAKLDSMCSEAGCSNYDELSVAERRSAARRGLERDLKEVEKQLRKLSAGSTIDEFVAEAESVDPDTIESRIEHLENEIKEREHERSELDQTIGREKNVLEGMSGEATAAELAEERQQILARLEADVEKYVRLKIASAVLVQTIEQYRQKHQGPVLERTNELFSRLTLGSFEGVRADYDEHGEPVLVGVRPGGKQLVRVEGMSDGTVDQLYLALRLASLYAYLRNNEPMPFIVDDILIRFDNERAVAALKILAELSKETQVIFFTHHRHLVELAKQNLGSLISKHWLSAAP